MRVRVAVVVGGLALSWVTPIPALAAAISSTTLLTTTVNAGTTAPHYPIVRVQTNLNAGSTYYVRGRWAATANSDTNILMGTYVKCTSGSQEYVSVYSTTNHIAPRGSIAQVEVKQALTARVSGPHECIVYGYARNTLAQEQSFIALTVAPGADQTQVMIQNTPLAGLTEWRDPPTATVLNASKPNEYFLRKTFTAPGSTSNVVVHSTPELTAIRKSGSGYPDTTYRAVLQMTPLKSDGTPCADGWTDDTGVKVLNINRVHLKLGLYLNKRLPVGSGCTRSVAIKTRVYWISGSELRVENLNYSNALAWTEAA